MSKDDKNTVLKIQKLDGLNFKKKVFSPLQKLEVSWNQVDQFLVRALPLVYRSPPSYCIFSRQGAEKAESKLADVSCKDINLTH